MATNKWLTDMQTLKTTTNILRDTLREKNISAYDTDTLQTLVSKVPNLAPIEIPEDEKWQPDPLWVFPDPNGTDEMKTIRQIYDEDKLADSYQYHAIYQIRGDLDTIDLKEVLHRESTSYTFILSDGTTYSNITDTSLKHTWDKSKDIIDSKGNRMRYVRLYSDVLRKYVLGFYKSSVWGIDGFFSNVLQMNYSSNYLGDCSQYSPLECLEIETNILTSTINNLSSFNNSFLKKLVINRPITITSNFLSSTYNIKEIELDAIQRISITGNNRFLNEGHYIQKLKINGDNYAYDEFILGATSSIYSGGQFKQIEGLETLNSVTTLKIHYQFFIENLTLPQNIQTLSFINLDSLESIIIPENCKTVTINNCYKISNMTIPSSIETLSLLGLYGLKSLNIPIDFNVSFNISASPYMEHDSLVNILNNLKDLTGDTAKTLTLGTTNLDKLTEEEKEIAINKNWTLA